MISILFATMRKNRRARRQSTSGNHGATRRTVFLGEDPAFWTFGKSQKIVNLRRDPRITCLIETGTEYAQLKGVELVGRGTIITDPEEIIAIGLSTSQRHTGADPDAARPFVEAQAGKRLGVRIEVDKVVSWDHTKLGGSY